MKYVALLRGINVGGNRKVEMKRLKALFESLGYTNVSTYLNSGNALFESDKKQSDLQKEIRTNLETTFGFAVPVLVKNETEIKKIAKAIPADWENDTEQKTDIAYLFDEIDSKKTIADLPIKLEFVDVRYVSGALIWNISRNNLNKSQLAKLASHKIYRLMTVRNVNTARHLANAM